MVIGETSDPATQLGPAISTVQKERIMTYVEGAMAQGARAVRAGRCLPSRGHFVEPTVLSGVRPGLIAGVARAQPSPG